MKFPVHYLLVSHQALHLFQLGSLLTDGTQLNRPWHNRMDINFVGEVTCSHAKHMVHILEMAWLLRLVENHSLTYVNKTTKFN